MSQEIFKLETPFGVKTVDCTYEMPTGYGAGYSKDGETIYLDCRLKRTFTLKDERSMDTTKYVVFHEAGEKYFEDTYGYKYPYAHEKITGLERKEVESDKFPWDEYQSYILNEIKRIKKLDANAPIPENFDDKPERDSRDYSLIKTMQKHQKFDRIKKPETLIQAENNPILLQQIIEEVGPRIQQIVEAASFKKLERYNLRVGRIFGIGKDRYKIIELSGNVIVYKDLQKDKILYEPVNDLLEKWNLQNAVEISDIDHILEKIRTLLTPFLGVVLVAALLNWLTKKVK